MKKILFIIFPLLAACVADPPISSSPLPRGPKHKIVHVDDAFKGKIALIIGNSNYRVGVLNNPTA